MSNFIFLALFSSLVCLGCLNAQKEKTEEDDIVYPVTKSESQWKALLSPEAFYVLRKAGTEKPFTGKYNKHYQEGTYHCAGCLAPLYESKDKYDSGTGWPSFDQGIDSNIELGEDYLLGYRREELKCSQCGGHLGHRFDDGPKETTGQRHCINSVALEFKPKEINE